MIFSLAEYGFLRIATVSPECKVADLAFNSGIIREAIHKAIDMKCHFLLFPELAISSYSCGDLFFQSELLEKVKNEISNLAAFTADKDINMIFGAPLEVNGKLFNTAVFISIGVIKGIVPKTYLCNSNEYYEERWFSSEYDRTTEYIDIDGIKVPFGADLIFTDDTFKDFVFGIEICEDLWAITPPSNSMAAAGATVIFNLSASNEYLGKHQYRKDLIANQSARLNSAYIYSSCGPGESSSETVFSGHCLIAETGKILTETERFSFKTEIAIADVDLQKIRNDRIRNNSYGASRPDFRYRSISFKSIDSKVDALKRGISPHPFIPDEKSVRNEVCSEIFNIQVSGLIKRLNHIGIKDVLIGVSGGLDSTLALLVAIKAFNRAGLNLKGIRAISMPGFATSELTYNNASKLCKKLKVNFSEIPICDSVNKHFEDIGHDPSIKDIVYENAQARERTQILMDLSNKFDGIVIGTGDLSESALGWSTFNGDQMAMYNVNSGIPKTLIKYIVSWCSEVEFTGEISETLRSIIDTPISPELIPGENNKIDQKTESLIGPYELHDFYLYNIMRLGYSPKKIFLLSKIAFEKQYSHTDLLKWLKIFYKRFFNNQFKRSTMPEGVKVGTVSLSPRSDWRMPGDISASLWLDELNKL